MALIKARHQDLLETRSPVRKRRRHLLVHPKGGDETSESNLQAASQISILHVEDNAFVASMVKEMLELEDWKIESCADGILALEKIVGDTHYDLILLERDLPGVNGLELLQRARSMAHRRQTPIVFLSANAIEREALDAGASAVLHKPEGIGSLADTLAGLLSVQGARDVSVSEETE
jgi:CheY-like chemotaxis protein